MDLQEFKEADPVELAKKIATTEGRVARIAGENKSLKKDLADAIREAEGLRDELRHLAPLNVLESLEAPAWLTPKKKRTKHHGTPFLMLSDLHLDEVVDVEEMDGQNCYNREIAEMRLERVINSTIELCDTYVAGLEFDGIVCALGGDIITGIIHDELAESNEATVPETIVHWAPLLASGIKRLADRFGKVYVPCVDGNHDRMYHKIRMKKRATSSYAWIIYNSIAMLCADDDRITFSISKSPELLFDVYDTTFLLDHGDKFRGGGGIGGLYPPALKWLSRKQSIPGREFDYAVLGHWHQLIYHSSMIINGSLKGADEYARNHAFAFERPQQALFIVTPENGITIRTQVYADSKAEGWQR